MRIHSDSDSLDELALNSGPVWTERGGGWRSRHERAYGAWQRNQIRLAYMQSPEWERIRKRVLRTSGWTCSHCLGTAEIVHHKSYTRLGGEFWEDLEPLCKPCHKAHHGR